MAPPFLILLGCVIIKDLEKGVSIPWLQAGLIVIVSIMGFTFALRYCIREFGWFSRKK